jgi:hypothetical protein
VTTANQSLALGQNKAAFDPHSALFCRGSKALAVNMKIIHKNCLTAYFGNLRMAMAVKAHAAEKPSLEARIPQPLQSLMRHEYNLCLMLELFDERLKRFEATLNEERPEFGAYSEAMAFLDTIYLLSRMLLDSAAGVVRHFYKCNENCELPKSFHDMLKKSAKKELPDSLNPVFADCDTWFPHLKDRRDDIVHHYETYFIGFERNSEGKMTTVQFSPRNKTHAIRGEDLRSYLGVVMAGYQRFIDVLLDYLDTRFLRWYGIVASIKSRQLTILENRSANILWWAYRYGGYKHDNLVVDES